MYRDLKFESAIDFAHDLVRIPSLSGDEGAAAERVVRECKLLRFDDVWSDGNALGEATQTPTIAGARTP